MMSGRSPLSVVHAGTRYRSFSALARAFKMGPATVRKRYLRGVRGEELVSRVRVGREPAPLAPAGIFAEERACQTCEGAFIARAPAQQHCDLRCYMAQVSPYQRFADVRRTP